MKTGRALTPHRLEVEIKKTGMKEGKKEIKMIMQADENYCTSDVSETETKSNDRKVLPTGKINHKRHLNCCS